MSGEFAAVAGGLRRRRLLPPEHLTVFVAGSLVRGWGNPGSDLDVYVVCPGSAPATSAVINVNLSPGMVAVETTYAEGRRWDIEYWLDDQVDQLLAKVSWQAYEVDHTAGDRLNQHEMDLLERLTYAVAVSQEDWLIQRRKQLADSALRSTLLARGLHYAELFVEDAVGQLRSGDMESAALSARLAFGHAIDALLAGEGQIGRSGKWRARRFREAQPELLSFERYWAIETMRDYDPSDPSRWIEDVVLMCRRISLEVAI